MTSPLSPQHLLLDDLNAQWKSFALQAAAQFNFATLIGTKSKTTAELAGETGTQERWVYRVLRFLAAYDIFVEDDNKMFRNTERSWYLCDGVQGSLRPMALMMGSKRVRREWNALEDTMKSGVPAVELLYGKGLYAYLDEHPEENTLFDEALASFSTLVDEALATAYDFSAMTSLVDVGGGRGSLLLEILARSPTLHGILFERPSVLTNIEVLKQTTQKYEEWERMELVAGDFFRDLPAGADGYILKEVLHNWDDAHCRAILASCRRAMRPDSVLLLCEQVISPQNKTGAFAKGLDLWMGIEQQGGERTHEEFRLLCESAGFRLTHIYTTHSPHWILEGVLR